MTEGSRVDTAQLAPRLRVRVQLGDLVAMGPGKSELLSLISETGSISAAARRMGMSYRRAWLLVEEMNRCFCAPVVETVKGGRGGGGARLTETGGQVVAAYHALEQALYHTAEYDRLSALLVSAPPETSPV
jgi:molybdate transport system regulatory protein